MSEERNELIPIEQQFPVLAQDIPDLAEVITENLGDEGIDRFMLERIKVQSGGAPGFVIEAPEQDADIVKSFEGLVVLHHAERKFYKEEEGDETGMGTPPSCKSFDAKTGVGDNGTGGAGPHSCATCPQAQWASAAKGGGQACRLVHAVYLYRSGAEALFPSLLFVPTASVKRWKKFAGDLTLRGFKLKQQIIEFATEKHTNDAGQPFSVIVPRRARALTDIEAVQFNELMSTIKDLVQARATTPGSDAETT